MIIYSDAYKEAVEDSALDLGFPRIGYQSYTVDAAVTDVTVSSEAADAPGDAPLRPDTAEYWEPTALPATWQLDLGTLRTIDYLGIAGHTLGHAGCTVEVKMSDDGDFDNCVVVPDISGHYISTPDSVALGALTGDVDIRVRAAPVHWLDATEGTFVAKDLSPNKSFRLRITATGTLKWEWSADGTTPLEVVSTAAVPFSNGVVGWVRVTFDVDNGAAGRDTKFYTSTDGVVWTQLGATVTGAGVTSIFNGTAPLTIGVRGDLSKRMPGQHCYAEFKDGIDGTTVALFDAEDGAAGDLTITSSTTAEVWTLAGVGTFLDSKRFGESIFLDENSPLMFLDTSRSVRYIKIAISGSSDAPKIGAVYVGAVLVMERMIEGSFQPIALSRQTQLTQTLSRGGHFLGQSIRRNGFSGGAQFKLLTDAWYRANFDPFAAHARSLPYFYAWNPLQHVTDIVYAWTIADIRPQKMGTFEYLQVGWEMYGQA